MITLENDYLKVSIDPKGAQLTSLLHKPSDIEHLWQADPAVWPWHAPNLFPVVGGCLDNELLIDGKEYPMQRHGFARQSEFTVVEADATQARFSLRSNEKTLESYPYRFDFQIAYRLDDSLLTVIYHVANEGDTTMYFSVGAHPAFRVPFLPDEDYEDYYLEFQKEEPLERHLLSEKGYFTGETEPVLSVGNQLPLTNDMFDQDALVFKNLESRAVTIRSRNHNHVLAVSFTSFPYLGIWAKPGAPFVCIEPWLGLADNEGTPVPIQEKEGIQHVAPGESFEAGFIIGVPNE